jgi:hypothetical protein
MRRMALVGSRLSFRSINSRLSKFLRPFKEAALTAGLIVGMSSNVGHAIDRVSGHFASAEFLTITRLAALRLHGQAEFDQAARCLRKSRHIGLALCPLHDGSAQHRSRAESQYGITIGSGTTSLFWFSLY